MGVFVCFVLGRRGGDGGLYRRNGTMNGWINGLVWIHVWTIDSGNGDVVLVCLFGWLVG